MPLDPREGSEAEMEEDQFSIVSLSRGGRSQSRVAVDELIMQLADGA